MNIIQLLDEVGHTKLTFQYLHECVVRATSTRGGTNVTFGTTEMTPADLVSTPRKVGVVVWMPIEDFERVQAQIRKG